MVPIQWVGGAFAGPRRRECAAAAQPQCRSVGSEGLVERPTQGKREGQAFIRCAIHAGINAPGRPVAIYADQANCGFHVEIANPECSRERARDQRKSKPGKLDSL